MSPRALLLRVLLILSLVLNGSGYAVASTQMHLAHMATVHSTIAAADMHDAAPPCHEQGGQHAGQSGMHDMATNAAACDDAVTRHAAPDCCQSSQCACDWLQHATATLAQVPVLPSMAVRAPDVRAMHCSHAAPALANPIRPPIG